ncbi:arginase family protein [Staphylococcus haemolyticus]|uniref:arginase family protein n=1 Tax=Staphylococcus haemolyticus TaxID=1283 RepID=UPI0034DD0992
MYIIDKTLNLLERKNNKVLINSKKSSKSLWLSYDLWKYLYTNLGMKVKGENFNEFKTEELKKLISFNFVFNENLLQLKKINLFGESSKTANNTENIILVGYDSGNSISHGSRESPKYIKKISEAYRTEKYDNDNLKGWLIPDLWDGNKYLLNNSNINSYQINGYYLDFLDTLSNKLSEFSNFWLVGGDHSITYSGIKSLIQAEKKDIVLIYFDAHIDGGIEKKNVTNTNQISKILSFPEVTKVYQIGRRGVFSSLNTQNVKNSKFLFLNSTSELPYSEIENSTIYCSIDLDILDPSVAKAVSAPVPNGFSLKDLENELKNLYDFSHIDYGDITEYQPQKDDSLITGQIIIRLLLLGLSISSCKIE